MTEGNFVDYVKMYVSSGNGGKGSTHLHREKYISKLDKIQVKTTRINNYGSLP